MWPFSDRNLEKTVEVQAETIRKQAQTISELIHENAQLNRDLARCRKHCKHRPVKLVIHFSNINPSTMSLELKTGQTSVGTLQLLYADDNTPVPGVTFQNVTATSANNSIVTVTPNADATVTATGIGEGTADAVINALANFSDSSGTRSEAVTVTEQITVDAVPPPPRPVKLSVNWSTPV